MRSVRFQQLVDFVQSRAGIDPALPENAHRAALVADYAQDAIGEAWTHFPWPEIWLTEERTPTGSPATSIPFVSAETNPIGSVVKVHSANPATHASRELSFIESDTSVTITDADYAAGTPVWVEFTLPRPVFSLTAYNPEATYAPGDVVFYNGDCWKCIAQSTDNAPDHADFWLKQTVPAFLADYIKTKGLADLLLEIPGQENKADYLSRRAEGILLREIDEAWLRKGRVHHYTARFQ